MKNPVREEVVFNGERYTLIPVAMAGGTCRSWSDLFPCDPPQPGDEVVILRPRPSAAQEDEKE